MRWTEFQTDISGIGVAYVDVSAIDAIGPRMTESLGGRAIHMRLLYLRGGAGVAILDTPDNMEKLFQTTGVSH